MPNENTELKNTEDPTSNPTAPEGKDHEKNGNTGDGTEGGVSTPDPQAPESETKEVQVDYEAELAKLQKRVDQAEHVIVDTKKQNKALQNQQLNQEGLTEESVREMIKSESNTQFETFKQSFVSDAVSSLLQDVSSDPAEQKLIKFHYENSIKLTGSGRAEIKNDLESAKLLANKRVIFNENAELKEALKAKQASSSDGRGNNQSKTSYEADVKLDTATQMLLDRMNNRRVARGEKALTSKQFLELSEKVS